MNTTNRWMLGGLSLREWGRRLWQESQKDELMGRAAQLSYYALLALFPALLFLTALMGLFSVQNFMPEFVKAWKELRSTISSLHLKLCLWKTRLP